MIFDNFRRKLRQEAEIWRDEGLIDASLYQQLAERYQFNQIETAARDRFVFILIGLGSILLGLGVITFVAANWQAWTKEVKITLLLSLFLITNITGFYLWRQPHRHRQRRRKKLLGEGLLLLGALILGANLGLLSQMFHISGSGYELYLVWGLGVLAMAYSLRLTSLGMLSLILVLIGYLMGRFDYYSTDELTWTQMMVLHLPLVMALLFVPLAYWLKSQWIFRISAIALAITLQINLRPLQALQSSNFLPWVAAVAFALPPALLWSYDDLLFPKVTSRLFKPIARNLTLVFISILFYVLSFRWLWESRSYGYDNFQSDNLMQTMLHLLIDVVILGGLALYQWYALLFRQRRGIDLTTGVVACFIVITAVVAYWHQNISPLGVIAIFIFNALLAMLACGLIREGLELGQRRAFWGGMVLLTLQIISRMLEYNTELLFKSFVFVLCGVAVITAGLWFEHHLSGLSRTTTNG